MRFLQSNNIMYISTESKSLTNEQVTALLTVNNQFSFLKLEKEYFDDNEASLYKEGAD